MPKFSVIIPTKDDSEVFDAIESVRNQSFQDFEIIVVDASEGAIQESLESHCETNNITYLYQTDHNRSANLNGARNLGIEKSSGEIIALMDGDCTAEEDWLKNLQDYFENHMVVESNVEYVSEGKKCPMDRAVQNSGRDYGFLGAGLTFRREVWTESSFDEELNFRDDTAFGLEALKNNFSYTYGEQARIKHHAGKFSAKQFMTERMRFESEAVFFDKYRNHPRFDEEANHVGRVLYPKEFAMFLATVFALGTGLYNAVISGFLLLGIMAITTAVYYRREDGKRDLDFCPIDIVKLFFLTPITFIFIKRYAIWKGAFKNKILVI